LGMSSTGMTLADRTSLNPDLHMNTASVPFTPEGGGASAVPELPSCNEAGLWACALEWLQKNGSTASYETWFKPLRLIHARVKVAKPLAVSEATEKQEAAEGLMVQPPVAPAKPVCVLSIAVPSTFARTYLKNNAMPLLLQAFEAAWQQESGQAECPVQCQLRFQVEASLAVEPQQEAPQAASLPSSPLPPNGSAPGFSALEAPQKKPEAAALASSALLQQHAQRYHQASQASTSNRPWTPRSETSQLNPRYVFEQLVVGEHNRFPHAAAMAIAQRPAVTYNPFFVYGPVGLGKTHLVQAIGHQVLRQHPHLSVKYLTMEQFTNELIQAITTKSFNTFRERYRKGADVLIFDDIQFLEGKERTQEELFHTFNSLYEAGKQLILTSDREPKALISLEERLRSRFECGLIADIAPPDLETRLAILQLKVQRDQLDRTLTFTLPLLQRLAERFPTNVRELEGALNKVAAYAMLTNSPLNEALLDQVLGVPLDLRRLSMDTVLGQVANYYHLQAGDLKGPNRSKEVSTARQVCIYMMREQFKLSYAKIGEVLGGRKHATILYAYERMKETLHRQPLYQKQLDELCSLLQRNR
jgi:chromosomal replication initiator protein